MQCEACGATLHENAKVCPNCQAPVGAAAAYHNAEGEETVLDAVERFLARHVMPHARVIILVAVIIILLSVLLAWRPWSRPEPPSPYSFPVPGLQR